MTEQMTHNVTEHCLSNHVLKPRSMGCHAGLQSLGDYSSFSCKLSVKQLAPFAAVSFEPWASRWCISSGLCRPSDLSHFTRRSPEAWGLDSSHKNSGLIKAWEAWPRNDSIPNDLILLILLKFKLTKIAQHEWTYRSMNFQHAICLTRAALGGGILPPPVFYR